MKPFFGTYFSYPKAFLGIVSLLFGAVVFFYLSYFGVDFFPSKDQKLLIIIDRSLSMAVEDVKSPLTNGAQSRLQEAKENAKKLSETHTQVGVITYAKNPTLFVPISEAQHSVLSLIESIIPEADVGGSDLPLALEFAKNLYEKIPLEVIIFTDGGSTGTTPFPEMPKNWRISLFPIGSENGGKIPLGYNAQGEKRYKYYSGTEVIVSYSPETLKLISKKIGATILTNREDLAQERNELYSFFQYNRYYIIAGLLTILGLLLHPYVRKK
ncbi:MAG: hypothetical protein HHAS10_03790 [Candidatus Altimarinota bacterium]